MFLEIIVFYGQWQRIILDARPSCRSNFLHFHAVFGNIWTNNRMAPLPLWYLDFRREILNLLLWVTEAVRYKRAWQQKSAK